MQGVQVRVRVIRPKRRFLSVLALGLRRERKALVDEIRHALRSSELVRDLESPGSDRGGRELEHVGLSVAGVVAAGPEQARVTVELEAHDCRLTARDGGDTLVALVRVV